MKTSHIFASLVLAAGLLSGCSKQAPEPTEAPAPAVEPAPAPETTPVDPASVPASEASSSEAAADVPPAQ